MPIKKLEISDFRNLSFGTTTQVNSTLILNNIYLLSISSFIEVLHGKTILVDRNTINIIE